MTFSPNSASQATDRSTVTWPTTRRASAAVRPAAAAAPHSHGRGERDPLAWLIAPVTRREFEQRFYEQQLCLVSRADPHYYSELLGIDDLDTVLGTHDVAYPEVKMVRGETDVPTSSYANAAGRIDPRELAHRFDEGATVIFDQLHRRVPTLARLCVSIGKVFSSRVQTNIYFTPPHAQGFQPHWDTHDVFVLQLQGTKTWSVYDTKVALPLKGQDFDPSRHRPGPVSQTFTLRPGDVAYLPRGLVHSATSGHEPSLHITLGITAFTWADLFLESVAAAALDEEELRHTLPLGFGDGSCPAHDLDRLYRQKLDVLGSRLDPDPVWKHFQAQLRVANAPLQTDVLGSRQRVERLTLDSVVSRRAGLSVDVERAAEGPVLRFSDREVRLPMHALDAIDFVATCDVFAVRDLPDSIDERGKLTLVRRLAKEGLLQIRGDR